MTKMQNKHVAKNIKSIINFLDTLIIILWLIQILMSIKLVLDKTSMNNEITN